MPMFIADIYQKKKKKVWKYFELLQDVDANPQSFSELRGGKHTLSQSKDV